MGRLAGFRYRDIVRLLRPHGIVFDRQQRILAQRCHRTLVLLKKSARRSAFKA